jgi:hypothetical protein
MKNDCNHSSHLQGKFLQSVYRPTDAAWTRIEHLTEESDKLTSENRLRLFAEWSRYWDLSKEVLLEKSHGNEEIVRLADISGREYID